MGSFQIENCISVVVTKNLAAQTKFYKETLNLETTFDNIDTIGFGKDSQLFIVLRKEITQNSHHNTENKGAVIITFKCFGSPLDCINKLKQTGTLVRNEVKLPDYNSHFVFIEDADGNEVCLDFPLQIE